MLIIVLNLEGEEMYMSDSTIDRRIIRTKRMIRNALTELMEEKGFEGVTVRDLTEKADINRGTFYLHYRDKFDLMEQCQNEMIQEIKTFQQNMGTVMLENTSHFLYDHFPFVVKLFEYIIDNAHFMKTVLGPKGDPSFETKLKKIMQDKMKQNILEKHDEEELDIPIDYFTSYVVSAHLGVIQHWLESGMKESQEDVFRILSSMTVSLFRTI
jgi:AcrR family transcriptional regulator